VETELGLSESPTEAALFCAALVSMTRAEMKRRRGALLSTHRTPAPARTFPEVALNLWSRLAFRRL